MKALRLHDIQDLRLQNETIPTPGAGEELVKVSVVGVCGSDVHWVVDGGTGSAQLASPLVLGHEFAGVIQTGPLQGQLAAIDPAIPCETCEFCLHGHPNLCEQIRFAGQAPDDGALREYIAWPGRLLFPLPDNFDPVDGAMLEPLGVAIHTVDLGGLRPGMTVSVHGCGPIGLLIAMMARLAGATRILVTDKLAHRLEAANALGFKESCLAHDDSRESETILNTTRGRGVDVAFEAAGENPAVESAVEVCKPGGKVILCGIPSENHTTFNAATARRKGLTFKMVRRMKHTYPRAIDLVARKAVDVRSLVTHTYPLGDFERAFGVAQRREGIKVMIAMEE